MTLTKYGDTYLDPSDVVAVSMRDGWIGVKVMAVIRGAGEVQVTEDRQATARRVYDQLVADVAAISR